VRRRDDVTAVPHRLGRELAISCAPLHRDRQTGGRRRTSCRCLIFLVGPTGDNLQRIIRQRPLHGFRIVPRCSHPNIALLVGRQDDRHGLRMDRRDDLTESDLGSGLPQAYFRRDCWMFRLIRFSANQALDPFRSSKDIRVKREIIFPVCYSEKVAAFFIVHRSLKASCEKSQLLVRRLLSAGTGPPVKLRPLFASPLLFLVRTCVRFRPSFYARSPVFTRSFVFIAHRVGPPIVANRPQYRMISMVS
jgi:hypothetical protein